MISTSGPAAVLVPLFIPSPSRGVWHLGPFPVRAYALCIITGVLAAIWLGNRRFLARGGQPGQIADIAIWAVPFGIVGGRLYHVITDNDLYFGAGKHPVRALEIWNGGLGIWGAIFLGGIGAWIACRRQGLRLTGVADALAPALLLAQAIGRWGNYFNQELFGRPTTLPWALEIAPDKRPPGYADFATFHPTYLYECLWDLGAMGVVIYLDRRLKLGFGRAFALYVFTYCLGRFWIEDLRIDTVELNDVLGLRLNVWTAIVVGLLGLAYFVVMGRRHPEGREPGIYLPGREPVPADSGARLDPDDELVATTATSGTSAEAAPGATVGDDGSSPGIQDPVDGPADDGPPPLR